MALPSLWQSSFNYQISTDVYEGPLDILLHLIESAELDITKLSLAKVTDQYLNHLRNLTDQDPVEVSAFLVIAAKLVFIKSSILLPSPKDMDDESEEDIGNQLARQLIEYKKFKIAANWLKERNEKGLRSYYRVSAPPLVIEHLDISDIGMYDLIDILVETYFKNEHETPMSDVVAISALTLKTRIDEIKTILRKQSKVNFSNFLSKDVSRLDVVVTFLALLELVKNHAIIAAQESLFSDIAFETTQNLDLEFELEL
ncbi:MAG: segregation/condensation protein A [Pelolinea sp.]|nr:segregation/condensation protein A [Pelolinea sp.]